MKKTVFLILVLLGALVLILRFGVTPLIALLGIHQKSGIKVTAIPEAKVYLNDEEVGKTSFEDKELKPGMYKVKLQSEKGSWEGNVDIKGGTLAVVNRELGETMASSSGEVLTLLEGKGVTVVSQPTGAKLEVDGKAYGITPLTVTDLSVGEHTFILSHDNYLKRSIRAYIPDKLSLLMTVDLALAEVDVTSIPTPAASAPQSIQVTVNQTPNGFLRVREKASTTSKEIGRVNTGETLPVIEETTGWFKVSLSDGTEGFVSATYVEKKR